MARRKWVQQVLAKCVNCGEQRWLNPGDEPVCEKDFGPMYAVGARTISPRLPHPKPEEKSRG